MPRQGGASGTYQPVPAVFFAKDGNGRFPEWPNGPRAEVGLSGSSLDSPFLGRDMHQGMGGAVGAQPIRRGPDPHRHGPDRPLDQCYQFVALAASGRPLGPENQSDRDRRGPDLRDRPLALGHDAIARVAGTRRPAHVPRHVRLLCAEPFPGFRLVHQTDHETADAVAAADRQHGGRLGPSAGGRVRPVQHGPSFPVPDHRLPEPSAAVSGISRYARPVGRGHRSLEERTCSGSSSA